MIKLIGKYVTFVWFALLLTAVANAALIQQASQAFVTNRIAIATNAALSAAKNYTDNATTNAAIAVVSNNVASWAFADQQQPRAKTDMAVYVTDWDFEPIKRMIDRPRAIMWFERDYPSSIYGTIMMSHMWTSEFDVQVARADQVNGVGTPNYLELLSLSPAYQQQIPLDTRIYFTGLSQVSDTLATANHVVAATNAVLAEAYVATTNKLGIMYDADNDIYGFNAFVPISEWAQGASWEAIEDTPTTLEGYGITDAYQLSDGNQLASQVSAIGALLNAEDARFVSTNYDSVVHIPEAYVEVKISNNWISVWREMTRWDRFVGSSFNWQTWSNFGTWSSNVTATVQSLELNKADRAWGAYDSETGLYAPDGYTQISSSNIVICSGMGYQRTVASGSSIWVLQCNSGVFNLGGDTNGYFRILDADGQTQFEIVKGDKREIGADASGIAVNNATTPPTVTIPYSVEAAEHPIINVCDDLTTGAWKLETEADCIANVTWSGASGAWVATVQRKTAGESLFVKATYMTGGETYIRQAAPVSMDAIMINGTKYYLGTAVINGHTVLTLSTTANQ